MRNNGRMVGRGGMIFVGLLAAAGAALVGCGNDQGSWSCASSEVPMGSSVTCTQTGGGDTPMHTMSIVYPCLPGTTNADCPTASAATTSLTSFQECGFVTDLPYCTTTGYSDTGGVDGNPVDTSGSTDPSASGSGTTTSGTDGSTASGSGAPTSGADGSSTSGAGGSSASGSGSGSGSGGSTTNGNGKSNSGNGNGNPGNGNGNGNPGNGKSNSGNGNGDGAGGNGKGNQGNGNGNGGPSGGGAGDGASGGESGGPTCGGGDGKGGGYSCEKDDSGNKACSGGPSACAPGTHPSACGACVSDDKAGDCVPPSEGGCWITGGGFIVTNDKDNFGGNAKPMKSGAVDGHWNHVDHATGEHALGRPEYIYCRDVTSEPGPSQPGGKKGLKANQVYFGGHARYRTNGAWADGYWFDVVAEDHGEPGNLSAGAKSGMADTYHFTLRQLADPKNLASGTVVYEKKGELTGGNIQIHPSNGGHPAVQSPLPSWVALED